jgi:hypothetical protein
MNKPTKPNGTPFSICREESCDAKILRDTGYCPVHTAMRELASKPTKREELRELIYSRVESHDRWKTTDDIMAAVDSYVKEVIGPNGTTHRSYCDLTYAATHKVENEEDLLCSCDTPGINEAKAEMRRKAGLNGK